MSSDAETFARMAPFVLFVSGASALLHWRIATVLLRPWDLSPGVMQNARLAAAALSLVVPFTFFLVRFAGEAWADRLALLGWLWMGLFSILAVQVLAIDLLRPLGWVHDQLFPPFDADRRRLFGRALSASVAATGLGLTAWAGGRARQLADIVTVPIPIPGLHPSLEGFRIAQISDIHVGAGVREPLVRAIVEQVNDLSPDLVAVTGDLVDGPVDGLSEHVEPLRGLRARHGAWFVTGNHEYYSGVHAWCEKAAELGMTVLNDSHRVIDHGGAQVIVAGITDRFGPRMEPTHFSDPARAVAGAPKGDFRLLLAHQPRDARKAVPHGFHLQLSGHTHAGQYAPFTWLIHLAQEFVAGLHRVEQMWLYVNRGTTWWGPPLRLGARQEITLLELRRG